mgnify:FL=1|tara:strand:- start:4685 stop:5716 length:1032 start_codon:yes stop_codon:yes gene_type:complete
MSPSNKILEVWLNENNVSYLKNVKLSSLSWLKAGGTNEIMIFPQNLNECELITKFFLDNKINYYPIGNLSNIIFRDGNFVTPLINMRKMSQIIYDFNGDNITLELESGLSITKLSNEMKKNSITGFEGLAGIPGTIGGGVTMNASSYNNNLCEYLTKILVIDEKGSKLIINKKELNLSWRYSLLQKKNYLVIKAFFSIPKTNIIDKDLIEKTQLNIQNHRIKFQEKKLPNLGSLFATKNLYKDLSKVNLKFKLIYYFSNILESVIRKLFKNKIFLFRKILVQVYINLLEIDKNSDFSLSEKTINCLINKGSNSGDHAIKIVKAIQKKIGNHSRLENIIINHLK